MYFLPFLVIVMIFPGDFPHPVKPGIARAKNAFLAV